MEHFQAAFQIYLLVFIFCAFCEQDVDECEVHSGICMNGGTCCNLYGSHLCVCVDGWEGKHCENNIDDCMDFICFYGGTCIDMVNSFHCLCPEGKLGLLCHLDDACMSSPCVGKGSLCDTSPIDGQPICTCAPGWEGELCDRDMNE